MDEPKKEATNKNGQTFHRERENATVWFYVCDNCGFTDCVEDIDLHVCEED